MRMHKNLVDYLAHQFIFGGFPDIVMTLAKNRSSLSHDDLRSVYFSKARSCDATPRSFTRHLKELNSVGIVFSQEMAGTKHHYLTDLGKSVAGRWMTTL